ncbi:PREDICTED: reticulon-like protein B11 isoform X2 [Tarenaya hassleriana]|uniref:reticulon-like protein B11 isoform X2 n=1 Tax=Tarenaya hassleriana TaxID=28532 RepID=UPI00053C2FE6|nr:PREDICTED: reticulon-like protein B11 isoform X2 [Tarenaya hassleriana]
MGESHPHSRISVHQALGDGSVADLLLWRNRRGAVLLLGSATLFWFLFEKAGYNFLSFVANVQLLFVVILFLWAKSASLLNRPMPPLPSLEISEASALKVSDALQVWLNRALSVAHDIAVGRNVKSLFQVRNCPGQLCLVDGILARLFLQLPHTTLSGCYTQSVGPCVVREIPGQHR